MMAGSSDFRTEASAMSDAKLDAEHVRLSLAVCAILSVGDMAPVLLGRHHHAVSQEWDARFTPRGAQGVRD
jgi:hypothetical protein